MPKLIDQKLLSENPMVAKYAALRKAASRSSKPVSKEQARAQISRYSREQRPNVYASRLVNEDGALILINSQKK